MEEEKRTKELEKEKKQVLFLRKNSICTLHDVLLFMFTYLFACSVVDRFFSEYMYSLTVNIVCLSR